MTESDSLIGKTINGYEMLDVVGRGGMAAVYRAQQVSMNRVVAVKVLPEKYLNDDTYIQRFEQEVAIVAKLEHRNIVPVHDYGEFNGQPYIVMRYMAGGSVDDLLDNGPLDIETIVNVIEQVAPALDYAHNKSVLHRDLKPSNVLMDDGGGAYLTDFGIARVLGEQGNKSITTQGVVGTPSYMSPEQAQGLPLDGRSDLYALGVMLFELTTGRRPFEADTPYGVAVMQVTAAPPSPRSLNPALSLAVEEVILRSLRKKPDDRYQTAAKLSDALKMAANKPVMSLHDTQPGFKRQFPQQVLSQPPPAAAPMYVPPAYTPPLTPNPAPTGYANVYPRRKRRSGGNVWVSAALGGLLGCGVLVVIVITALLILGSLGARSEAVTTPASTVTGTDENAASRSLPTLDATSQSGRETLIPQQVEATPGSALIAPVGERPTPTVSAERPQGSGLAYSAGRT
jgi:serine/threonine-protein kinase